MLDIKLIRENELKMNNRFLESVGGEKMEMFTNMKKI